MVRRVPHVSSRLRLRLGVALHPAGHESAEMRTSARSSAHGYTNYNMRFFRRSLIMLGVAATLPSILFIAVGVFYFFRTEKARVETETLNRSANIIALSDAAIQGDVRALSVLSSSVYFENLNWAEFQPRVERVLRGNPHWEHVYVFDAQTGKELLQAPGQMGVPRRVSIPG